MKIPESLISLEIQIPWSPNSSFPIKMYINVQFEIQFPTKLIFIALFWIPRAFKTPIWEFFMASGKNAAANNRGRETVPPKIVFLHEAFSKMAGISVKIDERYYNLKCK